MLKRNARKLQKNIIPSINEMINVPIPQLPLHELCHFIICRVFNCYWEGCTCRQFIAIIWFYLAESWRR